MKVRLLGCVTANPGKGQRVSGPLRCGNRCGMQGSRGRWKKGCPESCAHPRDSREAWQAITCTLQVRRSTNPPRSRLRESARDGDQRQHLLDVERLKRTKLTSCVDRRLKSSHDSHRLRKSVAGRGHKQLPGEIGRPAEEGPERNTRPVPSATPIPARPGSTPWCTEYPTLLTCSVVQFSRVQKHV